MSSDANHLRLLRSFIEGQPPAALPILRPDPADRFHDFLERHALRPFFWPLIEKTDLSERLPDRFVSRIRDAHSFCADKNQRLLRHTAEVQSLLDAASIDAVTLKGPLLATRIYGDVGRRASGDVDFLLRDPDDLARADAALRREGFERRSINLLGARVVRALTYEFVYRRGDLHLDLHWALRRHFALKLDHEGIWQRSGRVSLHGSQVRMPADPDLLWCSILTTFSDVQHGKARLRAFVDLWELLRRLRAQDWEAFLEKRRAEGLLGITHGVVDMLFGLLGGREELPELTRALEKASVPIRRLDSAAALALLDGSDASYRNRFWGFELYDAPRWKSLGWAVMSTPVKALVYRRLPQRLRERRRRERRLRST